MPTQNRHIRLVGTVLGIGLLTATSAYAEQPREPREVPSQGQADGRVHNTNVTGGFYEDRYKLDDWYYDFYDSPGFSRADSGTATYVANDSTASMADAAHPSFRHQRAYRTDQNAAATQYAGDPWFYAQRDPLYGIPEAGPGQSNGNVIKGTVKAAKQVRNRTTGDQNTVVLLTTPDRRQITADLGSSRRTMDLALTQGDPIVVAGSWEDVGPYSVLMAQQVRTEAKRVSLNRQIGTTAGDRTVEGRIQQFRDIRMNRGGEVHRAAAVQTQDGRMALVDLGPDNQDRTPLRAAAGDRMVAQGPVVQVGNYPVLWANRVAINDSMPVDVTRTTGPTEFLPGTGNRSENCLGAGCDNQPLNQGQSGRSNSNAMDGTTR
ncbi:MAG: exported protein of unknown function [Nitrospira sp.]|nr:MAG: exported protein of unknown function [Nitrospira sp.]